MIKRHKKNPILTPNPRMHWEADRVYNPGIVLFENKHYLFYRAKSKKGKSSIGLAISTDGENFKKEKTPIIKNGGSFEEHGVEDPRITRIDSEFYLSYTAYNGKSARLKWAKSNDLKKWKKLGLMLPDWKTKESRAFPNPWDKHQKNKEAIMYWNKSGGIFPEKINNKFLMLFGDSNIWFAESSDLKKWSYNKRSFLKPRKGKYFDNLLVEMGAPPIKTKKGWLVLYNGISKTKVYSLGYILLDLKNPSKILKRSKLPILTPETPYEKKHKSDVEGRDNKVEVVFCNGAILNKGTLEIFYGASDKNICKASININILLK